MPAENVAVTVVILDREYRTSGVNAFDTLGFAFETYGAPRTVGVQIRYHFP